MIATNDLHYTHAADADTHEVLLCVQSGKTMADPNRFKFDARDFYLKSAGRDALAVGRQVRPARGLRQHPADRRAVRGQLHRGQRHLHAALPGARGRDRADLVRQGGRDRPARAATRAASPTTARKQAEYEVGVIIQMGFPGYFLVVADFINWAKDNGIRVGPGRGSGAGSIVAYAMRITDLDPLAARPDLRAVPQPRPRLDARLRRRLRRAPSRRGDPLRQRASTATTGSRRSSPTARSRPSRRSRTPPACSATRSRWATGSPRSCRRR